MTRTGGPGVPAGMMTSGLIGEKPDNLTARRPGRVGSAAEEVKGLPAAAKGLMEVIGRAAVAKNSST